MRKLLFGLILSLLLILFHAQASVAGTNPLLLEEGQTYLMTHPFDYIVAFGDSLSDNGNLYDATTMEHPDPQYYFEGRFSNGPVWVEYLEKRLGLNLANYAWGGGETGTATLSDDVPGVLDQVAMYLANIEPSFLPSSERTLITIWAGANNFLGGGTDFQQAADDIGEALDTLASEGESDFMVFNLPDLGATPRGIDSGEAAAAGAHDLSIAFNNALGLVLDQFTEDYPLVNLYRVDAFTLFEKAQSNPLEYGFSNANAVCPSLQTENDFTNDSAYLFWDTVHPTAMAHDLIASRAILALGAVPVPETENVSTIDWKTLGVSDTTMVENILQITVNPYDDRVQCWGTNPWGPKGEWIVYTSRVDGSDTDDSEICKIRADGTGYTRITDNDIPDSHASFSPDGTKIVFQRKIDIDIDDTSIIRMSSSSITNIFIMNADGTGEVNLTQAHATNTDLENIEENKPVISPDGLKIAFHTDGPLESIWVMGIDGSNPVIVSEDMDDCSKHSWSPDSLWVLLNAKTTDEAAIDYGSSRIYKAKADGSQLVKLSDDNLDFTLPGGTVISATEKCENWATWSPDGEWIAYHAKYEYEYDYHTMSLMKQDGTEKEHLVIKYDESVDSDWESICAPKTWSPDSNWLSYKMRTDSTSCIFTMNINTDEVRQLTEGFSDRRHWWSPNGDKILFRSTGYNARENRIFDEDRYDDLMVINLAPWFSGITEKSSAVWVEDDSTLTSDNAATAMTVDVDITDPTLDPSQIMLCRYEVNPTETADRGVFWDLYMPDPSNVSSVTVKLYLTESQLDYPPYWFNEDTGNWVAISDYTLETEDAPYILDEEEYAGYVAITIDDNSSPSLSQLTGTVFLAKNTTSSSSLSSGGGGCFVGAATGDFSAGNRIAILLFFLTLMLPVIAGHKRNR
jgi:phospholipase/lecithinase/hemolysin/Tol biopolymer transport system component